MSRVPVQSPPVKRPHLVHPHECVDVEHGETAELVAIRLALLHGANYNDPQAWRAHTFDRMRTR